MPQTMSLSLSPRYDLFRVMFDKTFLPQSIQDKYQNILNQNTNVIASPIDYLNESIQGFHFPGISELIVEQQQLGHNGHNGIQKPTKNNGQGIEPTKPQHYISPANTLSLIEDSVSVTFRMNIGLYNYFMLYETILLKQSKAPAIVPDDDLYIDINNEAGLPTCRIILRNILIDSLDGLDLSYSRVERQNETFDLRLKYNDIEFKFIQ